jgi:hypothetical protein
MQFGLSLLRIKGLYMFRALLAHRQEACYVSWLHQDWRGTAVSRETSSTQILVQPTDITRAQYTKYRLFSPPEDEQVTLETCRGP